MHEQKWRNEKHRKGAATMEGRARLVRNYGIETVNAATMARGVHRANSCATTRAPAQLADVVVPMLRGA